MVPGGAIARGRRDEGGGADESGRATGVAWQQRREMSQVRECVRSCSMLEEFGRSAGCREVGEAMR